MRRVALALLLLASCEKDRGAHVHREPPHVGDRVAYHSRYDSHLTGPDGAEHAIHEELTLTSQIVEVDRGHAQHVRVDIDRNDSVSDGTPRPTLSGSYDLFADGRLTRSDGKPPSDHEREFFGDWHIGIDDSALASKEFHTGETYQPSPVELVALDLPPQKHPWVLGVRTASNDAVVLAGENEPPEDPPGIESHIDVVLTLSDRSHIEVDDLVVRFRGNVVGGSHTTIERKQQR